MTLSDQIKEAREDGFKQGKFFSRQDAEQYFRFNKWGIEIVKRGSDYDVANVVKGPDGPDPEILGRAMWPDHAMRIVDEHNDTLAKALFPQTDESEIGLKGET